MVAYTEIIAAVPRPSGVPHGATLSGAGSLGIGLEWKHAAEAFVRVFGDCRSGWDVLGRVLELDGTTFLGLGCWVLLVAASLAALVLGVVRLGRGFRVLMRPSPPASETVNADAS